MNSRRSLLSLAVLAVLSLGAIACGGDDDDATTSEAQTTSTAQTTTAETNGRTTTTTEPPPKDEGDVITVKGGQPDGGVQKLKAKTGDKVKITVNSDEEGEIHLHGYDIMKDAGPGSPAVFEFDADIPGIFEIEVEDTGTQIGELEVS